MRPLTRLAALGTGLALGGALLMAATPDATAPEPEPTATTDATPEPSPEPTGGNPTAEPTEDATPEPSPEPSVGFPTAQPTEPAAAPVLTPAPAEDDPSWDCRTDGNRHCGVQVGGVWYVLDFETNTFTTREAYLASLGY